MTPDKIHLAIFIVLSLLFCALSSKSRNENEKEESHTPNLELTISGKNDQSLFALTDTLWKGINISSSHNPLNQGIQETNANTTYPVEVAHLKYTQASPKRETATDALQPANLDRITYISTKGTNRMHDGIRHEFLNASHILESPAALTKLAMGEKEDEEENQGYRDTKNKLAREAESSIISSKNADVEGNVEGNVSKSLINAKNNTREVEFLQKQHGSTSEDSTHSIFSATEKHFAEKSGESLVWMIDAKMQNVTTKSDDRKYENQTAESRTSQEQNWEPGEDDLTEAANYGLQAMHNLYYIQEPKLYSMGLYLGSDEPARYVAAFNDQSEEARDLARFGYAVLQGATIFSKKFPDAPLELPLSRSTRRTVLEQQCPRRGTPQCPLASLRYRTSDGSCNNLQHLWWGSAMSTMQRFLPAVYHDGIQSIRRSKNGKILPSAREVTSLIHEDQDIPLASVTHMLMQWGQFVDHDLTATGQSRGFNGTVPQCCLPGGVGFQPPEFMHPECLPIAVNLHDSFYGPLGVRCLEFLRSGPAPKEGCEFGTREQLSQVTSYLDASMVYSSNALHSDSLRIFRNGLLQYGKIQSRKPSLPKIESDLCKRGSLSTTCFRAGDGRLSEQPALTSLHVVFLRLHNRIATELSALNSHWSDEKLFQETRRIVGAVVQHITYREFLPIVLGPEVMKIFDLEIRRKGYYEEYNPTVNPTVANAFSTAAYRFGHSLVQRSFVRFDSHHRPLFNNVSIHDEFSNPVNLETAGSVDRLVLGLVNQPCQRRDEFITEEMTNHLFQTPGFAFGMDLASLNIQRGRDHGLPPYARWREICGLSPMRSFEDLERVISPSVARKFRSLYSSLEDIDLFPAGLAEKSVVGGLVGPTFACIIGQQFSNLRRGDRFWYENPESESSFTAGQLQQIRRVSLAQVLCRTMDGIKTVQPFVFLATDTLKNQRLSCDDPIIGQLNLEFWAERPSKFRYGVNDPQKTKRTVTDADDPAVSRSKVENANARKKIGGNQEHAKIMSPKPFKTSIQQNNHIVLKRPYGRPDNVTIVVQNNAVNQPVFMNEGIYGSKIRIQPVVKPSSILDQIVNKYPFHRPIPTAIPHSASFHTSRPYVPQAYDDPSNPNPLAYGYRSPLFDAKDDIVYDNYSATSPRPTLYTYYTNFQQKPSTQVPEHEIDGYLINYGVSHHEHDSVPAYAHDRPIRPSANPQHFYESKEIYESTQKPHYGVSKPPVNAPPISRPNYASNNGSYEVHEPSYENGLKPPTISRPTNFQPNYESNDQSYHGHKPNYNRPKPTSSSSNSRPNSESYYTQKPVYVISSPRPTSPANSRPDSRPNYPSHSTQKPSGTGNGPHLQTIDGLNNRPSAGYSANSNKPQHQEQWNLNGYQTRPSERPYDQDDPDLYHKKPNIKPPSGFYSNSMTNVLSNHEGTLPSLSTLSPAYSPILITNHNNHDRYPDVTPVYEKRPLSTPNSWTDVSSYTKGSSTRLSSSDFLALHSSPLYQKSTSRPIYQKDEQSQLSSYSKPSIDRPLIAVDPRHEQHDPYRSPSKPSSLNDQLLSSTSQQHRPTTTYWSEASTIGFQVHKQEETFYSKPTKVQSVTIVTETIDTVRHPGHSGYISQHTVTSEIPRPLAQQMKNNMPIIRKPGQYYYEKNVLHRYPEQIVDQIPRNNLYLMDESKEMLAQDREIPSEKIITETSIEDSITNSKAIRSNENKSTTTPTLVITDYDNKTDDVVDDLEGAFSANVESIESIGRMNYWTNPQEDLNLPSMLEMPRIPSDELANAKELPKPIKSRGHAS